MKEDKNTASSLRNALRAEGLLVWWDEDLQAGEKWEQEIENALHNSSAILVLWSNESVRSEWVKHEACIGKTLGLLTQAHLGDISIPPLFDDIQSVDLTNWNNGENDPQFVRILESIKKTQKKQFKAVWYRRLKLGGLFMIAPILVTVLYGYIFSYIYSDLRSHYISDQNELEKLRSQVSYLKEKRLDIRVERYHIGEKQQPNAGKHYGCYTEESALNAVCGSDATPIGNERYLVQEGDECGYSYFVVACIRDK
jgi:hypothetical protein